MTDPQAAVDPTTIGDEPGRVALQRRREARVDHVHEIPFNERAEITCPDCGEATMVGIYGETGRSYDSCWTWDCDAFHKFERDRDAETTAEAESTGTTQTKLVPDGGAVCPTTTKTVTVSGTRVPQKLAALAGEDGFDAVELQLVGVDTSVRVRVVDGTVQVTEGDDR